VTEKPDVLHRLWDSGRPRRCLIVAEVGLSHDGSLGTALAFVDAAASAGVDAVKFQTHLAEAEGTPAEEFRVRFSRQDASRADYWRRTAFEKQQWTLLAGRAREKGLLFLSSPFSIEAARLLHDVGIPAWKIASGEVGNRPLLEFVASLGAPVLLSSGMSDEAEMEAAVSWVRAGGAPVAVMQCTTAYPCPPERVGLNQIARMRERFACPAGLSDHSGTVFAGLAAATLGADLLEVHLTLSRRMFGPDVVASVTVEEMAELVRGVRWIEAALAHPIDKDIEAAGLHEMRRLFTKSIVAARPLAAGTVLSTDDLAVKKPGTGIPAARLQDVIGRRLSRAVGRDEVLGTQDVEGLE
jgi:N-acetylneuraminate synthase